MQFVPDYVVEAAKHAPVWRAVEEEMPEKHRAVLVCYRGVFGDPVAAVAKWNGDDWRATLRGHPVTLQHVRYWMPLPDAPSDWSPVLKTQDA